MRDSLKELQTLPNIGPRSAERMYAVGVKSIKQFQKLGPEKVYELCCRQAGVTINRAYLYVLRAAHFFTYNIDKRDQALRWWMWQDLPKGIKKKVRRIHY